MRLLNAPIGLIFNFHEATINNGMARIILKGAD